MTSTLQYVCLESNPHPRLHCLSFCPGENMRHAAKCPYHREESGKPSQYDHIYGEDRRESGEDGDYLEDNDDSDEDGN